MCLRSHSLSVVLAFFLCCYMHSGTVIAADPDFGDTFLRWVENNAEPLSAAFAHADFPARTLNMRNKVHTHVSKELDEIQKDLGRLRDESTDAEALLAKIPEVRAALLRRASTDAHLEELFRAKQKLDNAARSIHRLKHTIDFNVFGDQVLYEVARSELMQSMIQIGNQAASLAERHEVGIKVTVTVREKDADVQVAPSTANTLDLLAAHYLGPWVAAYFVLRISYEIYRGYEHREKMRNQWGKIRLAKELLNAKLLSPTRAYAIFSVADSENRELVEEERSALESRLSSLQKIWTELFHFSITRARAADQVLHLERVKEILRRYESEANVAALFNDNAIINVGRSISAAVKQLTELRLNMLRACGIAMISHAEELLDRSEETQWALTTLQTDTSLAPLWSQAAESESYTKSLAVEAQHTLSEPFKSKCQQHRDGQRPSSSNKSPRRQHAKLPTGLRKVAMQITRCDLHLRDDVALCHSSPGSQRYLDTLWPSASADPILDGLGGGRDGGFKQDRRQVADSLDAATANMRLRIAELKARHEKVRQALPVMLQTNAAYERSQAELLSSMLTDFKRQRSDIAATLSEASQAALSGTEQLSGDEIPTEHARAIVSEISAPSVRMREFPAHQVHPNGIGIVGYDPRSQLFTAGQTELQKAVMHETRKYSAALRSLNSDPTARSDAATQERIVRAETLLEYAHVFSDPYSDVFARYPSSSAVAASYLEQARAERYNLQRKWRSVVRERSDVIGWQQKRTALRGLYAEFQTCSRQYGDQLDLWSTPCNKFVGYALQRIYGYDDLAVNSNGWRSANDIVDYLRGDQRWQLIGTASNQSALDRAALEATKGKAVIFAWKNVTGPHGHVAIGLPGPPEPYRGNACSSYKGLNVPRVSNMTIGAPTKAFLDGLLTRAFCKNAPSQEVLVFIRNY